MLEDALASSHVHRVLAGQQGCSVCSGSVCCAAQRQLLSRSSDPSAANYYKRLWQEPAQLCSTGADVNMLCLQLPVVKAACAELIQENLNEETLPGSLEIADRYADARMQMPQKDAANCSAQPAAMCYWRGHQTPWATGYNALWLHIVQVLADRAAGGSPSICQVHLLPHAPYFAPRCCLLHGIARLILLDQLGTFRNCLTGMLIPELGTGLLMLTMTIMASIKFAAGLDRGTLLELLSADDLTVFSEMQARYSKGPLQIVAFEMELRLRLAPGFVLTCHFR